MTAAAAVVVDVVAVTAAARRGRGGGGEGGFIHGEERGPLGYLDATLTHDLLHVRNAHAMT